MKALFAVTSIPTNDSAPISLHAREAHVSRRTRFEPRSGRVAYVQRSLVHTTTRFHRVYKIEDDGQIYWMCIVDGLKRRCSKSPR